jgi:hypothetical protein
MRPFSAKDRREITDWLVQRKTGGLYGDKRDVPPIDCDGVFLDLAHDSIVTAKALRTRLAKLSKEDFTAEAVRYYQSIQKGEAMIFRRGRPKGSGYAQADEPLMAEMRELIGSGLTLHAAAQRVADRATGSREKGSKVRRLMRRLAK